MTDSQKIDELIKSVARNNKNGGWRKLGAEL